MKMLALQIADRPVDTSWLLAASKNPYTFGIVLCEAAGLFLWLKILSTVSVSRAVPLTASTYFAIMGLSWFAFHEPFLPAQLGGSALIVAGICLIASDGTDAKIYE